MLFVGRMPFLITTILCAMVLVVALIMEYGFGIQGCTLCKYERLVILVGGVVAAMCFFLPVERRSVGFFIIMSIFLFGVGLASYHVLIQQGVLPLPPFCKPPSISPDLSIEEMREQLINTKFVPCNKVTWSLFGFSLAVYNALFSLALVFYNWVAFRRAGE